MTPTAEAAYLFRHPLMRDGAYQVMPPSIRAHLHTLAAETIEATLTGGQALPEIAGHLRAALDWLPAGPARAAVLDREIDVCRRAGAWLGGCARHDEAIAHFERAAASPSATAELPVDILLEATRVCEVAGTQRLAIGLGERAVAIARNGGPSWRKRLADALRITGNMLCFQAQADRGLPMAEEAAELARAEGDLSLIARCCNAVATGRLLRADSSGAEPYYQEALALAREANARDIEVRALANLAQIHQATGRRELAREEFPVAIAIAQEIRDDWMLANLYNNFSVFLEHGKELADALVYNGKAGELADAIGARGLAALVEGNRAAVLFDLGDQAGSERHLHRAIGIARELGARLAEAQSTGNLGSLHLVRGQYVESEAALCAAIAILREIRNRRMEGRKLQVLAELYAATGRHDGAVAALQQSASILRECGDTYWEDDALKLLETYLTSAASDPALLDATRARRTELAMSTRA